eukprot:6460618-Amphidinium_carterae.1
MNVTAQSARTSAKTRFASRMNSTKSMHSNPSQLAQATRTNALITKHAIMETRRKANTEEKRSTAPVS